VAVEAVGLVVWPPTPEVNPVHGDDILVGTMPVNFRMRWMRLSRPRTGQRGAEAVVDAAAEAHELVVLAVGIEAVWLRDDVRVATAGGQHEVDQ
jgi:hypothetical protein